MLLLDCLSLSFRNTDVLCMCLSGARHWTQLIILVIKRWRNLYIYMKELSPGRCHYMIFADCLFQRSLGWERGYQQHRASSAFHFPGMDRYIHPSRFLSRRMPLPFRWFLLSSSMPKNIPNCCQARFCFWFFFPLERYSVTEIISPPHRWFFWSSFTKF